MDKLDAVTLTKSLLGYDTVNPPGREADCARHAAKLLQDWGYQVEFHDFAPGRTSVIARAGGNGARAPLCLTGHLDVVPLGARPWSRDPFAGETDGDRLYGRGSSDMKAGVAAILLAARRFANKLHGTPGVVLVLTASEEDGCVGSRHLAALPQLMGRAGAIVVGEPTSNHPCVGHKGSLKFHADFRGVSAHGSMPELGENAIYKAARAVGKLEAFDFGQAAHPVMGAATLSVGTFAGGSGVNLVPDSARIGVDIRTLPGMDHAALLARLRALLGEEVQIETFSDLPAVWTAPDAEWMQRVFEICAPFLAAAPQVRTATYMTDAANLRKVYGDVPTVVLGPGEPQMAHQTDEYCSMERIRESVDVYERIIADWCGA